MTRMSIICFAAAFFLATAPRASAEDYAGAKIVELGKGQIEFEHGGKKLKFPVAVSLKILDDKGEKQDPVTGTRFLAPGNTVDIKVAADARTKKNMIVEVRFVSGKVADLPKTPAGNADLRPDPNYAGQAVEFRTADTNWLRYLPTAKVGDFVEYKSGSEMSPGRKVVVECGKDYVIVARVSFHLGKRTEGRTKFVMTGGTAPEPATPSKSASTKKPAKPKENTEELEVAGKKLKCEVHKVDGKPTKWFCEEVPFDGLVKQDSRNYKYTLTDFGRGS